MRGYEQKAVVVRCLLAVVVFVAGMQGASNRACADDSLQELQRHVEELRKQSGGPAGEVNKRALDKARVQADAVGNAINAAKVTPTAGPPAVPRTHVRSDEGVPFPKYEEVVFEPRPLKTPRPSEGMKQNVEPLPYKRPVKCDGQATKRIAMTTGVDASEEKILVDTLYLREDLVPVDAGEVFGLKTKVFGYGPKSGEGVYLRMKTDAVTCLPYRIRLTNAALYYDTGNNALKNYDKQPSGRGVYHSWIQQKVFLGK